MHIKVVSTLVLGLHIENTSNPQYGFRGKACIKKKIFGEISFNGTFSLGVNQFNTNIVILSNLSHSSKAGQANQAGKDEASAGGFFQSVAQDCNNYSRYLDIMHGFFIIWLLISRCERMM